MKKPFDFEKIIAGFSIKIRNLNKKDITKAEGHIRGLIDDYLVPNCPYPPRKEFIFGNLDELLKYRKSGY